MTQFGKRSGGGRRRARREPSAATAVFTTVASSHRAILLDLSATGARMQSDTLPAVGEELIVTIELVRLFGSVAWVDGAQFGVGFDSAIPPAQLEQLRRRLVKATGVNPELASALDDWMSGFAR